MKQILMWFLLLLLSEVLFSQVPTIEWEKCLGGSGYDLGLAVSATADEGAAIVGITFSTDGDVTQSFGNGDVWIVKLDDMGNVEWQKSYGGSSYDEGDCIRQ